MSARDVLVYVQAATFIGLALVLLPAEPRLALAQALLAVITVAVYL